MVVPKMKVEREQSQPHLSHYQHAFTVVLIKFKFNQGGLYFTPVSQARWNY